MTLVALIAAFAPLVWAKLCIVRWRSRSYHGLLVGGAAVGTAGAALLVIGALFQTANWLSPLADSPETILILLGWFWLPEGVFMAVAGVVIRLTFGRRDYGG